MPISWFSHKNYQPAGEQELKFHVPKPAAPAMTRWLESVFRPHREHAVSTICSIYFDSAHRVSFREKEASDYRKTKYRIRWYADEAGVPLKSPAYLEIKEKHGAVRRKYRSVLPMPAAELAATPLTDALWTGIFRRHATGKQPIPAMELRPVLELRYHRRRYTHPVFSETFCLDSDIRCLRTHPGCLPPAQGGALEHNVFEQKGQASHPLPVLQSLPRFGVRRDALSKYFLMILQLQPE
jgi:hypothetical protein